MQNKKPIPYGISDFKDVVSNYYYIDKTKFIPLVENYGSFLYLIRPRRFGKSLFLNMLDFYYNVKYKDEFDLLKGTWIHNNPTEQRNSYHILKFDFSAVSTRGDVDDNFSKECNYRMDIFCETYDIDLKIDHNQPAHNNLKLIFQHLPKDASLYILIDEYDNFINDLLMNNKELYEKMVTTQEAIYKEFFKLLKAFTNQNDSPLKKMFFTGVSPLSLFDVTSGSNIGRNITNEAIFNDIVGVTKEEYKKMVEYYELDLELEDDEAIIDNWYNHYKFNKKADSIYNTDMILYYIDSYLHTGSKPERMIDLNVRTDYTKLKYLVHTNNKLNGNYNALSKLFLDGYITVENLEDGFSAFMLTKKQNFISLLYYLGLITIDSEYRGKLKLIIPNLTIKTIMAEFVNIMLEETKTFEIDLSDFRDKVYDLAFDLKLDVFYYLAKELENNTSVRNLVSQESDIRMFYTLYFTLNKIYEPFVELELNKGFVDLYLAKRLTFDYDVPNILVEFKFIKQSEKKPDIKKVKEEAKIQIQKYKDSKKFKVNKSIIIIFHGFKMVYCEWEE